MSIYVKIEQLVPLALHSAATPPRPTLAGRYGPFTTKAHAKAFVQTVQRAEQLLEEHTTKAQNNVYQNEPITSPIVISYVTVLDPQEKIVAFERATAEWAEYSK